MAPDGGPERKEIAVKIGDWPPKWIVFNPDGSWEKLADDYRANGEHRTAYCQIGYRVSDTVIARFP